MRESVQAARKSVDRRPHEQFVGRRQGGSEIAIQSERDRACGGEGSGKQGAVRHRESQGRNARAASGRETVARRYQIQDNIFLD